jgi:hypothetical protein
MFSYDMQELEKGKKQAQDMFDAAVAKATHAFFTIGTNYCSTKTTVIGFYPNLNILG